MPDLIISFTATQATQATVAIGAAMGLKEADGITPRSATMAESKQFVINILRNYVQQKERQDILAAAAVTPFEPT